MGNTSWGKVLKVMLVEVIKFFLPGAKIVIEKALEWAIDWAYRSTEEWASRVVEEVKPTGEQKMAMAVGMVNIIVPDIENPAVRMLLEAKHLEVTGDG